MLFIQPYFIIRLVNHVIQNELFPSQIVKLQYKLIIIPQNLHDLSTIWLNISCSCLIIKPIVRKNPFVHFFKLYIFCISLTKGKCLVSEVVKITMIIQFGDRSIFRILSQFLPVQGYDLRARYTKTLSFLKKGQTEKLRKKRHWVWDEKRD